MKSPGSAMTILPRVIHVEENLSANEPVEFIVARNSTEMLVINVADPRAAGITTPKVC